MSPIAPPSLTADSVTRALRSLGIAGMTAKDTELTVPAPITRDGPRVARGRGSPARVTPATVMEKRAELASGLRRPLGYVWPEPARDEHADSYGLVTRTPLAHADRDGRPRAPGEPTCSSRCLTAPISVAGWLV